MTTTKRATRPFNATNLPITNQLNENQPSADDLEFANTLAKLITSDFQSSHFTKKLYRRLSNLFGHIAHYNQHGFYAEWFSTADRRLAWFEHVLDNRAWYGGQPVEQCIRAWVVREELLKQQRAIVNAQTEARERRLLAQLQHKYDGVPLPATPPPTALTIAVTPPPRQTLNHLQQSNLFALETAA